MEVGKLTIDHYGENESENRRITFSQASIFFVAAEQEDVVINGRSLRNIVVISEGGESVGLTVNHQDLELLEIAVGSYPID